MPIQFPTNPTINQTYTFNSITWTWNGNLWTKGSAVSSGGGGATVTVSNTAPTSPTEGALWVDSDYGDLNAYFSNSWVIVGSGGFAAYLPSITGITGTVKSGFATTLTIYGNNFGLAAVTVRFSFGTVADVSVTPTSNTQLTVTVPASIYALAENIAGNISVIDSAGRQSNGYQMTTQIEYDGATAARAAPHAAYIKALGISTTGYYWIKPAGTSTAYQVHCDMTNNGGGWMLMSFCGTGVTNGAHVEDAYTGNVFNMGSTTTSITNTNPTAGAAGNMGQAFIDALVQNGRERGIALFRIHDAGTTWTNWYISITSTARWYSVSGGRNGCNGATGQNATNAALSGNQWLKSCQPTYTADTGNNGAGSISGTAVTYNNEGWGNFPFNMANNSASNWGYSIAPNYNNNTQGYSFHNSCHSNGWNRAGNFWLKIV